MLMLNSTTTRSVLCAIFIMASNAYAQSGGLKYVKQQDYQNQRSYSLEDGREYNEQAYWDHPDFGKLTFAAPVDKKVVEVISKRKLDERYYVDLDDPTFFYVEKSSIPINYWKDDRLRAIDYSLYANKDGYSAQDQPFPTSLNMVHEFTSIISQSGTMLMNQDRVEITYMDNSTAIFNANWNNAQIGNYQVYFTDYFPGIDKKLDFVEGGIKSEYILQQDHNYKSVTFIDNINLDQGLEVVLDTADSFSRNFVQIKDVSTGDVVILGNPALTYDNSTSRETWFSEYALNGSELSIICDSVHLNDPNREYPIVVDPLFVAVPATAGGFVPSDFAPSTCAQTLVIPYPGGSTPWDVSLTWNVLAQFCGETLVLFGTTADVCFMEDAQVWFTSSCGGSSPTGAPGNVWLCQPGCNAPGNWNPTLGFGVDPSTQSLVQCYTPSCFLQNLFITTNINRLYCPGGFYLPFGNIDNCLAVAGNSVCARITAWSATIQGRSVETLGNTATGNGTQNIFDADCAGTQLLNPTPQYGVPGYTYVWNPGGATTPTLTVPGTVSTYTVDVTDDCGNTVTATFDIGCPLSEDELSLTGSKVNNQIELVWSTESEKEVDYFELEHSIDGENWNLMQKVNATGDADAGDTYRHTDAKPAIGINMYRVNQYHTDGSFGYSETVSVLYREEFTIYPNPATTTLQIEIPGPVLEGSNIVIVDVLGKEILRQYIEGNSITLDVSALDKGNYLIRMERDGDIKEVQRLTLE
jgi:hypothetical protein